MLPDGVPACSRRALLAGLGLGAAVGLDGCAGRPAFLGRAAVPPTIRVGLVTSDPANGQAIGRFLQPLLDLALHPPAGLGFRIEPTMLQGPPPAALPPGAVHTRPELAALAQALAGTAEQATEPPDVVLFLTADDAVYAGGKGLLHPIDSYLETSPTVRRDAFFPGALQGVSAQGHIWGLPLNFAPSLLAYDPTALAAAGVATPGQSWSWEQFTAACVKVTNAAGHRYALGPFDPLQLYVYLGGGSVLAADGKRCALSTPAALAGVRLYEALARRQQVVAPPGRYSAGPPIMSGENALAFAVWPVGTDRLPLPATYRFAPPPDAGAGPVTAAQIGYVLAVTRHAADAAQAFAAAVVVADAVGSTLAISARRAIAQRQPADLLHMDDGTRQLVLAAAEVARAEPLDVDILAALNGVEQSIVSGQQDAAAACTTATAAINHILSEHYA